MAATTRIDRKDRGGGRGAAFLALTVGGLLGLAGIARLLSVLLAEPARVGLEAVRTAEAQAGRSAAFSEIAQSLAAAGRLGPFIVPWETGDRGKSLEAQMRFSAGDLSARAVLEAALGAAPGDPAGWVWLARMRLRDGDAVEAGQALRVSLLAGQVVPEMMLSRLRLGLDLYAVLDADTQRLVQRQVRLVWMMYPREIPRLFTTLAYRPILAEALAAVTPADEQQFRRINRLDREP